MVDTKGVYETLVQVTESPLMIVFVRSFCTNCHEHLQEVLSTDLYQNVGSLFLLDVVLKESRVIFQRNLFHN